MSHRDARFYTPLSVTLPWTYCDCGECKTCRTAKAQGRLDAATQHRNSAERAFHAAMSEYCAAYCEVLDAAKALEALEEA